MTHSQPLVSIVIPNYNQRHDFLRATIESVLSQTYDNFEIVLSENYSTNNPESILAGFDDPRLRIVRPQAHLSMVDNFTFGATEACGEFISFLPSDDLVEPEWLERLVPELVNHPEAVFAFGEVAGVLHDDAGHELYLNRSLKLPSGFYSSEDLLRMFLPFTRTASWLVGGLMRSHAYSEAGGIGQPGIRYSADFALALRLLEQGGAVYQNRLVGRHRVWTIAEGKTEGFRYHGVIADVAKLYQMIESSVVFRPLIERIGPDIEKAKRNKVNLLSMMMLEGVATGGVDMDNLGAASGAILSICPSRSARVILALGRSRIAMAALRRFHRTARLLYRVALAPWMNSISFRRKAATPR